MLDLVQQKLDFLCSCCRPSIEPWLCSYWPLSLTATTQDRYVLSVRTALLNMKKRCFRDQVEHQKTVIKINIACNMLSDH